jgi:hypothetical protein
MRSPQREWNAHFPKPDRRTSCQAAKAGDIFFFRSLEWILRHELAHVARNHSDLAGTAELSRAEEREADRDATRGIRGNLQVDHKRAPGTKPCEEELELERRALASGIGLTWVALYEETAGPSEMYPPISDRIFRCLNEFGCSRDSVASEVPSDFLKAWLDPITPWPALPIEKATASAALDEACRRLDEYRKALDKK